MPDRPRILLADQNSETRDYVRQVLAPNCQVETVADGEAALDAVKRQLPDLIIADVTLPRRDGFALLRALRQEPTSARVPVIMLSARVDEESMVEGLEAGADDYLLKPFSARELIARVGANLQTARVHQEATRALGLSEARLSFALTAGRLGYWELDLKTKTLFNSDIYKANWGRAPTETFTYDTLLQSIHPDDREERKQAVDHAIATAGSLDIEYRAVWPDGSIHWLRVRGHAVYDPYGRPLRMAGISLDITDRKRIEESLQSELAERRRVEQQQALLLAELNHRVKNTLAIVQSIATQTLRHADSAEAFRSGFEARIMALAEAHNLLTESNWGGATLRDIVNRVLTPYSNDERIRHTIPADDVRVGPKTAVSLVMAFHELATNAAKYGALSNLTGTVRVDWKLINDVDPPRLAVSWAESGGPPVKQPSRKGFGSRLIRGLAHETSGKVQMEFDSAGLVCNFDIPLFTEGQ